MSEIIASTYEIIGRLGAGGGGVVYLANHLRLGKKVVLKADKRSTVTKKELLRREVDILKELNHKYIPRVYDYFVEDGISYTVMDYIDGEALNRVIERERRIPQATVIRWARQLLEALAYLHSPTHGDPPRGYVHGDVKPGNIMLRPDGNICLIDFNIALAIGIESALGRSPGYSSPEHYSSDYRSPAAVNSDSQTYPDDEKTQLQTDSAIKPSTAATGSSSSYTIRYVTVLDARSDIYSVGATLYHLLCGKRPASNVENIEPLSKKEFSPSVVDIIAKAMNPDPNLRYADADEMLAAVNGLWKNDLRVRRQKKCFAAGTAILAVMLAAGGTAAFIGLKQMERIQAAEVLAANSAEALSAGDVKGAIDYAKEALSGEGRLFDLPYTPQAQLALTNALQVYSLADSFQPCYSISLPFAPYRMLKSPDEKKLLVTYPYELAIYDIASGEMVKALAILESALCEVEFIDDNVIVYGGKDGLTAYDMENDTVLWQADPATAIAVSGDSSTVAAVYKKDDVINFYNAVSGKLISSRSLDGKHFNIPENDMYADAMRDIFELNENGSLCAVSLNGGYMGFVSIDNPDDDLILYEQSDNTFFDGCFAGSIFAFSAAGGSGSLFGLIDTEDVNYIGDMPGSSFYSVAEHDGQIFLSENDVLVQFDINTFEDHPAAYTEDNNIIGFDISDNCIIAAMKDGYRIFYSGAGLLQAESCESRPDFVIITDSYAAYAGRDSTDIRVLKLTDHSDMKLFDYDPQIEHSETRLKADRSGAMMFNINGFTLLDAHGNVRLTKEIPQPEQIYDQQYRRNSDGEYLEVTYYSGRVVCYSADSGEIISETEISPPQADSDVIFETKNYRIAAPAENNSTPVVYDKASGERITELKADSNLTYITEVGDYIVAQYRSNDRNSDAFGVIMNEDCEPLAEIPCLCDISGDMLVCDYPSGNVKLVPVYELSELKSMAENYGN